MKITPIMISFILSNQNKVLFPRFIDLKYLEAAAGRHHAEAPHWCLLKHGCRVKRQVLGLCHHGRRALGSDSLSESHNKLVIYTLYKISFKMSINPSNEMSGPCKGNVIGCF